MLDKSAALEKITVLSLVVVVAGCRKVRLHLALKMIGWSAKWTPPPHHARELLTEAEGLADRLQE